MDCAEGYEDGGTGGCDNQQGNDPWLFLRGSGEETRFWRWCCRVVEGIFLLEIILAELGVPRIGHHVKCSVVGYVR